VLLAPPCANAIVVGNAINKMPATAGKNQRPLIRSPLDCMTNSWVEYSSKAGQFHDRNAGLLMIYFCFPLVAESASASSDITRAIEEVLTRNFVPVESSTRIVIRSASRCTLVTTP
jgi:hypothetical protein